MPQTTVKIGNCSKITQNKIIVRLEGSNLPKIGSYAQIKRKDRFITIGEVSEAIGSTRSPWIVISPYKDALNKVTENELFFSQEKSSLKIKNKRVKHQYKKRV